MSFSLQQLGKALRSEFRGIADDVEIGANTTIDHGAINDTVIEQGCKLDNQSTLRTRRSRPVSALPVARVSGAIVRSPVLPAYSSK